MSRRTLPAATRDRLTHILSDVERGLVAADSLEMTGEGKVLPSGDVIFRFTHHRANEQLRLALVAAKAISDAIVGLDWPADDRRQRIEREHDQVRQLCDLDRARFLAARRRQDWWLPLQHQLQQPAGVDRALRRPRADRRPFHRQLAAYMRELGWDDDQMAAATKQYNRAIDARTVERHRTGKQRPSRKSVLAYQKAISAQRSLTILNIPKSKRSRWK